MIDIKTQLHDSKNNIADASEECKEKIEEIELNMQILSQKNQQLQENITS